MWVRSHSFTFCRLPLIRVFIVFLKTTNIPFLVLSHTCTNPKKVNVSHAGLVHISRASDPTTRQIWG